MQEYKQSRNKTACLTDNELAAYADQLAGPDKLEQCERHLSSCDDCTAALACFAGGLEYDETSTLGQEIQGRYRIEFLIGRGAMGSVYRAYDHELERSVALKFLEVAATPREGSSALTLEGVALAKLSHPNVVSVYELGVLDGNSYAAMEYVEGETLQQWLAPKRSRQEILAVLLQAGEGIAAAHQAGVIHRDIKPSNVLVGSDGRVRVVDFGLARSETDMSGGPVVGDSNSTITSLAGTPAYLAPELCQGEQATPSSDQFAFCVTAYECLVGVRPKHATNSQESQLPKRLLTVLKRGLAQDPDARYPSMKPLLDDLKATTKTNKTWWFAGIVLLAGAILAFTLGRQEAPCAGANTELNKSWNSQVREGLEVALAQRFASSPRVAATLLGAIEEHSQSWLTSYQEACMDTVVRHTHSDQMMDQRMFCLQRDMAYMNAFIQDLESLEDAQLNKALRIAGQLSGPTLCQADQSLAELSSLPADPRDRSRLQLLAQEVERARLELDMGGHHEGKEKLIALETQVESLGNQRLLAQVRYQLALLEMQASHPVEARRLLHQAFSHAEASGDLQQKHSIYLTFSNIESSAEHHEEAARWLEHAKASTQRMQRSDDPQLAANHALHLGGLQWRAGKYPDALASMQRSLALFEESLDKNDPTITSVHNNLGTFYRKLGHLEDAKRHTEHALRVDEETFGEGHLLTASSLFNSGLNALAAMAPKIALEHWEKSHNIWRREFGANHPRVGQVVLNIGLAHFLLGDLDTAQHYILKALAVTEAQEEPGYRQHATILTNLATIAFAKQSYKEVILYSQQALDILVQVFGTQHPELAAAYLLQGTAHTELEQWTEAEGLVTRSLEIQRKALGEVNPALAYPWQALGDLAVRRKRFAEAVTHLEKALTMRPDDYVSAAIHLGLSKALEHLPGSRSRVHELAAQAKTLYLTSGQVDSALANDIENWELQLALPN